MQLKNFVVVGGGLSGIIAALLVKRLNPLIDVRVIESKKIGLAVIPEESAPINWVSFINRLELSDIKEFMIAIDATYKLGVSFKNWNGDNQEYYHHLLNTNVLQVHDNYPYLAAKLVADGADVMNYYNPVFYRHNRISLERVQTNSAFNNIGVHYDSIKLNNYLRRLCQDININFINADLVDVTLDDSGIKSVIDKNNIEYYADFFVDSTGFFRFLSKKLGAQWIDYSKYLPLNRAIVVGMPPIDDVLLFTKSVALSAGWSWQIPTYNRFGSGYAFNEDYITCEQAHAEIEQHYNQKLDVIRDLKFSPGKLDQFWIKNCVSTGLAAGFVEPLESNGTALAIEQAVDLAESLSSWVVDPEATIKKYNHRFDQVYNNVVDFVQLHYITKRNDSKFWQEKPFVKTDFNQYHVERFKTSIPRPSNFGDVLYKQGNWISIMHGLDMFDQEAIHAEFNRTMQESPIDLTKATVDHSYKNSKNTLSHKEMLDLLHNLK
jgi:tryptophan halogenase